MYHLAERILELSLNWNNIAASGYLLSVLNGSFFTEKKNYIPEPTPRSHFPGMEKILKFRGTLRLFFDCHGCLVFFSLSGGLINSFWDLLAMDGRRWGMILLIALNAPHIDP